MPNLRVISSVAAVAVLCACAGQNAAVKPDAATSASQKNPACMSETGSRLPSSGANANCSALAHSYSSDDIDRTGATTTGGALRLLDPSLTIIGH